MFKIDVSGFTVSCDSAEEVKALVQAFAKELPDQEPMHKQPSKGSSPAAQHQSTLLADDSKARRRFPLAVRAVDLLMALVESGESGVSASKIAEIFGMRSPKGIGPTAARVKRLVEEVAKVPASSVFTNAYGPEGSVWYAGEKTGYALDKLRQFLERKQ